MEQNRSLKIASLEVEISLLQGKEKSYQAMMNSPFAAPEIRSQAQAELRRTVDRIVAANDEITRLRSEL